MHAGGWMGVPRHVRTLVVALFVPLALLKLNPGPGPGGDAAAPPWSFTAVVAVERVVGLAAIIIVAGGAFGGCGW